jgi:hypothetical protein
MIFPSGEHALGQELAAIDREFPGWHAWTSDAGTVWAVTAECHDGGSGTTLDARTPVLMRLEIAEQQHRWVCFGSAA